MGANAERKDGLPAAPFEIKWCEITVPPCSLKSHGRCGIEEWLRKWPRRSWKKEAKRLIALAKKDPEAFRRTCGEGLWGW